MSRILITGASGLIGTELSSFLSAKGHEIIHLSRTKRNNGFITFIWNVDRKFIEEGALDNVDYVIHLAGAGIAAKRWSNERKKEIINSRVKSTELLFSKISKLKVKPKAIIAASAIGYYGASTSDNIYSESDPPADDFMGTVCSQWETSSSQFNGLDVRTVQLRFGVILSSKGGALEKMLPAFKFGLGSPIGNGKQYVPWIHINDVISIIEKSIDDKSMAGVYNVVSPTSSTNKQFSKTIAKVLRKPFFVPNVPSFILKLVLGEMSKIVLEGSRISSRKILDHGYKFHFTDLEKALNDLIPVK